MNRKKLIIIGVLIIMAIASITALVVRGVRNNNWGNIRHGGGNWRGMRTVQTDDEFVQFSSPEWGTRALARIVKNDFLAGKTLREVIAEYAPASENNTNAYVMSVSKFTGLSPDAIIDPVNDPDSLAAVLGGIVRHENGIQELSDFHWATIYEGIELERS